MKRTFTSLMVVVLLMVQLWLAATRGQVICVSTDVSVSASASTGVPNGASRTHSHSHSHSYSHDDHHSDVASQADQNLPCGHLHISTPNDPQRAKARADFQQHLLTPLVHTPLVAWTIVMAAEKTTNAIWVQPPPDPGMLAHVRALKTTRLLI